MRSNDTLKVIVVGISKTVDDAGLLELFNHYGSVADAKVVLDAATSVSRGFGFVTFTAQSAMRRAVKEMDKKQLDGRTLNVRQLVAKDKLTPSNDQDKSDLAKRPCYLLRKGKCTKGNRCPYSHDTKSGEFGSCFEFVQSGYCKRGNQCKFYHPPRPVEDEEEGEAGEGAQTTGGGAGGDASGQERVAATSTEPPAKKLKANDASSVAKPVGEENVKKQDGAAGKPLDDKKPKDDKPRYCFAYQTGRCHRGKRCLFLHKKLEVALIDAPPVSVDTTAPKRVGDFEVVSTSDSSKKRPRDSDDEDSGDEGDSTTPAKPVQVKKEKAEKKETPTPAATTAPTTNVDKGGKVHTGPKPVCRHFLNGACKRGPICFFRHERPAAGEEVPEMKHVQTKKRQEEEEDDGTPALQGVADHMAAFMANFSASTTPFDPSASAAVKQEPVSSPVQATKRKAEDAAAPVVESSAVESSNGFDKHSFMPPSKKPRFAKEKVDMGAAFDGASDGSDGEFSQPKGHHHQQQPKRQKISKEQMKANREKLREERRTKRSVKKQAMTRLRGEGEIELEQ